MNDSPAVILYDAYGNEIALADGYEITVDSKGIPIIIINDYNEAKFARADDDGYLFSSVRLNEKIPAGDNIIGKVGVDSNNTGGLALESTLIDSYEKLTELEEKDFSTETTLSSIKDTDGIKKINDPLPAGDNVIGKLQLVDSYNNQVSTFEGYNLLETSPGIPILASDPNGDAQFLDTNDDGYLITSVPVLEDLENERKSIVGVDFYKDEISETTHFLMIDLDNYGGLGNYKHNEGNGIILSNVSGTLTKSKTNSSWKSCLSVVTNIVGTTITMKTLQYGLINNETTNNISVSTDIYNYPLKINITIENNDLKYLVGNRIEYIYNTGTEISIENFYDELIDPEIGDLILTVEKTDASTNPSTVEVQYFIQYFVE